MLAYQIRDQLETLMRFYHRNNLNISLKTKKWKMINIDYSWFGWKISLETKSAELCNINSLISQLILDNFCTDEGQHRFSSTEGC